MEEKGEVTDVAFNTVETFELDGDEPYHAGARMYEGKNAEAMRTQQARRSHKEPTPNQPWRREWLRAVGPREARTQMNLWVKHDRARSTHRAGTRCLLRWSQHGANSRAAQSDTLVPQRASQETVSKKPREFVRDGEETARRQGCAAEG